MGLEAWIQRAWARPGGAADVFLWPLLLLSGLYGTVVAVRAAAFRAGVLRSRRLPVAVISVGNLAVGGTGKTPFTIHLARAIQARGLGVGILTRGYGGSNEGKGPLLVGDGESVLAGPDEAGDEAVLLARSLPGVPVVACADRYAGGTCLLASGPVDVILLDDGFQHLALARDADVVLVDGKLPFGNGFVLPRGPLREPPSALARAHLIVVRADDGVDPGQARRLGALTGAPVVGAGLHVTGVVDGAGKPVDLPPGAPVYGVCGIGRPERFRHTLSGMAVKLTGFQAFPDHAAYGAATVAEVAARATESGARAVVTTEKDAVKLAPLWSEAIPLWVVRVGLEVSGGADWVEGLLASTNRRFSETVAADPHPDE